MEKPISNTQYIHKFNFLNVQHKIEILKKETKTK